MKGLRYIIGLCVVLFAVVIGLHSVSHNDELKKNSAAINASAVVDAFKQEGMTLYPSTDFLTEDFIIDGKKPAVYNLEGTKERLFVYDFSSIDKRDEAISAIYNGEQVGKGFTELQAAGKYLINPLQAKNLLIFYMVEYDPSVSSNIKTSEDMQKFQQKYAPNSEKIKNTVFTGLNNGVTKYYYGTGKNWSGKIALKYYQYSWKDENGVERSEGWHEEDIRVKYTGSNPGTVKGLDCSYDGPGGGGSGTFSYNSATVDQEGYFDLGSNSGEGVLDPNGKYSLTIKWNGLEDKFDIN